MKKLFTILALFFIGFTVNAQICDANFSFTMDDSTGVAVFVDNSTAQYGVVEWYWSFGDGSNATGQQVTHTYNTSGMFGVCLTIIAADSCVAEYCDTLVYDNADPCAGFYAVTEATATSNPMTYDGVAYATAIGGTPPYTYSWDNGAYTQTTDNLAPGVYCVVVMDNNGCAVTSCAEVLEGTSACEAYFIAYPDSINPNAVMFYDQSAPQGVVSEWYWELGDGNTTTGQYFTHTYANAGTYTVCLSIVTPDSCTSSFCDVVVVGGADPCLGFEVGGQVVNASGPGTMDGAIYTSVYGGTPPYTFTWNNGGTAQNLMNISTGPYYLTVTDNNGCEAFGNWYVSENTYPCQLYITGTVSDATTPGGSDGAIDITVTGGSGQYYFYWDNSAYTEDLTGLSAGIYTVMVEDLDSCFATATFTVNEPWDSCALYISTQVVDASAQGVADGVIYTSVTGGTPPYAYYWNNGQTTPAMDNLAQGVYTLDVVDANGCSETITIGVGVGSNVNPPVDTLTTDPVDTCIVVIDYYIDTINVLDSNNVAVTWAIVDVSGTTYITLTYQYDQTGTVLAIITINCAGNKDIIVLQETFVVEYDMITGIKPIHMSELSLYPNPVKENLNIDFGQASGKMNLQIYNSLGQLIYNNSMDVESGVTTVNTQDFSSGIYILNVTNDKGQVSSHKFVK